MYFGFRHNFMNSWFGILIKFQITANINPCVNKPTETSDDPEVKSPCKKQKPKKPI